MEHHISQRANTRVSTLGLSDLGLAQFTKMVLADESFLHDLWRHSLDLAICVRLQNKFRAGESSLRSSNDESNRHTYQRLQLSIRSSGG
jgi:hypothetical protein